MTKEQKGLAETIARANGGCVIFNLIKAAQIVGRCRNGFPAWLHMQREESIEAQVRAMEQFARANNIVIVDQYFDRAKTGTRGDREQFQQLVKDSAKRKFDLVLIHKMDQFARLEPSQK